MIKIWDLDARDILRFVNGEEINNEILTMQHIYIEYMQASVTTGLSNIIVPLKLSANQWLNSTSMHPDQETRPSFLGHMGNLHELRP